MSDDELERRAKIARADGMTTVSVHVEDLLDLIYRANQPDFLELVKAERARRARLN